MNRKKEGCLHETKVILIVFDDSQQQEVEAKALAQESIRAIMRHIHIVYLLLSFICIVVLSCFRGPNLVDKCRYTRLCIAVS